MPCKGCSLKNALVAEALSHTMLVTSMNVRAAARTEATLARQLRDSKVDSIRLTLSLVAAEMVTLICRFEDNMTAAGFAKCIPYIDGGNAEEIERLIRLKLKRLSSSRELVPSHLPRRGAPLPDRDQGDHRGQDDERCYDELEPS